MVGERAFGQATLVPSSDRRYCSIWYEKAKKPALGLLPANADFAMAAGARPA